MTAGQAAGGLALAIVAVNVISLLISIGRIRPRKGHLAPPANAVPVSIVRPVRGIETFSEETLRSGFLLDYPDYEYIFCVADADDPIVPLVRRLMAEHPAVPSRLIVGDEVFSDNPKLNNCARGWAAARHDWVILADSNLLMPCDYVQRLQAKWRPDTGLVCSTPAGSRPDGFWAEIECAFLNTHQARWQYVGEAMGLGFAQGKSLLWHKPFLEQNGGIRALASETAEDAAATKIVRGAGLHVHLVDAPFEQPLGRRSFGEVWKRQVRWARLRRVTFPLFFAPEIASGPVVPILLAGAACGFAAGPWSLAALAILASWYGLEAVLAYRQGWPLSWRQPALHGVRDVMNCAVWAAAWVTQEIVWRGNAMRIRTDGPEGPPAAWIDRAQAASATGSRNASASSA